jgi:hypothetical protein
VTKVDWDNDRPQELGLGPTVHVYLPLVFRK